MVAAGGFAGENGGMFRGVAVQMALPFACAWVWRQERAILRQGTALSARQMADARRVGVRYPERIRVRLVDEVPAGLHPLLKAAGGKLGWVSPHTVGMSLRYGILIRADGRLDRHLLVHELAHTVQYERLGGLRPFLKQYLRECLTLGYDNAPMEEEAERMARGVCG